MSTNIGSFEWRSMVSSLMTLAHFLLSLALEMKQEIEDQTNDERGGGITLLLARHLISRQ